MKAPNTVTTAQDINFLLTTEAKGDKTVDLSELTFIKPVGVVAILAAIERMIRHRGVEEVTFTLPVDSEVCAYLRLAGVFDVMRTLVSFSDPQPEELIPERPPVRPMVPCTHFNTEYDIEILASRMEERFPTEMAGFGSLLGTCHTAFAELATNAVNHAESQGGYVLAQRYNYRSGPIVEISVADCGIGIQRSLQKNHKYIDKVPSDEEAIELSIEEGVSSIGDSLRGYGLYHVTDDVKQHRSREITIRSGFGTLTLQGDGSVTKRTDLMDYPGTIVSVVIPCS